jgi:MFS family permease
VRAAFLASTLGAASLSIWAALASTFGQFVAARVLAAFFYAAPEALGPQIVADVFFLHQRATATGAFTLFQFLGFSLAGLIGGFATLNLGWRAPSWVMVYTTYGAFVGIAILMPETSYTRAGRFVPGEKRTIVDHFRVWPASGGGAPKVKSKRHAFAYPWYYLPHPIVLLTTAYFSIYLATNDYMLTTNSISYPTVYKFDLSDVALTSLAPTLGNICGIIYGGFANDRVRYL